MAKKPVPTNTGEAPDPSASDSTDDTRFVQLQTGAVRVRVAADTGAVGVVGVSDAVARKYYKNLGADLKVLEL